jgi:2-polyprenyl-3-methyl-5-hydroxy-6-metoxy-1,4-benzoquinol methylase
VKHNRPSNAPGYFDVLWDCILKGLGRDLVGLQVVDIGSAEGYFSFAAAKLGGWVTAIQPPHYFVGRFAALSEYFGLSDRVEMITGYYPAVGRSAVLKADIVLCLGLIYHLDNLIDG